MEQPPTGLNVGHGHKLGGLANVTSTVQKSRNGLTCAQTKTVVTTHLMNGDGVDMDQGFLLGGAEEVRDEDGIEDGDTLGLADGGARQPHDGLLVEFPVE